MRACWLLFLLAAITSPALAQSPPHPTCQSTVRAADAQEQMLDAADEITLVDGAKMVDLETLLAASAGRTAYTVLVVKGGDFSDWDFSGQTLKNICFLESNLERSIWNGAEAPGIGFVGSNLSGAQTQIAYMPEILLRDSSLANVDAMAADWKGGRLDGGWGGSIENLVLDLANLSDFVFDCGITISDGCPLDRSGISLRGADLTHAKLDSLSLYDFNAEGAALNGTRLSPDQLAGFAKANVLGPVKLASGDADIDLPPDEIALIMADIANTPDQPAFDCDKAGSLTEKTICGEYESELRAKDRTLAKMYRGLLVQYPDLKSTQLAWLKVRDRCLDEIDCLTEKYDQRISALMPRLGEPEPLQPGQSALYVVETLRLSDAFRATPLFAKIAPVLAADSYAEVVLTGGADGGYDIAGLMVGANAHTCTLSATGARYDEKSSWFIVASDGGQTPLFRLIDDRIEIYGNGVTGFDDYPALSDYVSCGARGYMGPMRQIILPEAMIAERLQALSADM